MTCEELQNRLAPYVDSELTAGELSEFESHLRDCAACTGEALELMRMKHMIRTAAVTRFTPTPDFRLRVEQSIRAKAKSQAWWMPPASTKAFAAAAFAVLLIAAVLIWTGHIRRERAFTQLADLHVATLASSNPVDVVSTDRHTVKPWFAGKLPFSFNLPELQNSEFALDGGRVAYFQRNSGAQLLFKVRKHELSVFVFKEQPVENLFLDGTHNSTELGLQMETWNQGGLRYFVISDASSADVRALSELLKKAGHP